MTCRGAACLLYALGASSGFVLDAPRAFSAASGGVGLAPGSIVALYFIGGPNVSDTRLVRVRVQPEGSAQVFACPVLSVGPNGVWAVLPAQVPPGPVRITLAINGDVFPSTVVTLVPSALALFSVNQFAQGWGALAQNLDSLGAPSLNRLTNPAVAGQYVTLWGTGLGNVTTSDVTVDLAGERIPAYFAGHSPGLPGMDQISFRIPADAFDGCYVPVMLRAAGMISNSLTISKATAPGACVHPLGLSAAEMKTLDNGGSIPFGSFSVSGGFAAYDGLGVKGYLRSDTIVGQFAPVFAAQIALLAGTQFPAPSGPACQVTTGASYGATGAILVVPGTNGLHGSLVVTGPAGQRLVVSGDFGQYFGVTGSTEPASSPAQLPPPFFSAGAWTLSVSGDEWVADFQQILQLPPELKWTNRDSLNTISRTSDTAITWDPSGYSATDIASITLSGSGAGEVDCLVPANAGSVTLSSSLLGQLTPTTDALLSVGVSSSPRDRSRFNVPLKAGGSMPVVFGYGFGETLRVVVK